MAGSTIGLMAKLGVETDERQVKRETESLKDKITQAAEAEMTADTKTLKRDITRSIEEAAINAKWVPDRISDGIAGAIGAGAADAGMFDEDHFERISSQMEALGHEMGHGTRLGRPTRDRDDMMGDLFGGMKGAGGKFLKVGLAGAVGFGILAAVTKFSDTAPRMNKVLEQIWRSISLFARPFLDLMARLIEPYAQEMLELAAAFNADYNQEGLRVALVNLGENILEDEDAGLGGRIGRQAGIGAGAIGGAMMGAPLGPKGMIAGGLIGGFGGMHIGGKVGDAIGDAFSDFDSWLRDQWPGWGSLLSFPGWIDVIIDPFPGWIANSPGIIDPWPGWAEWLNPLNWDVPGASEIGSRIEERINSLEWDLPSRSSIGESIKERINPLEWEIPGRPRVGLWIRRRIDPLEWDVPGVSDVGRWMRNRIPEVDWNIPSRSDILDIFHDRIPSFEWPTTGGSGGGGGGGGHTGGGGGVFPPGGGGGGGGLLTEFAHGGLVTRPTQAVVGEAGPEVIAPFDEFMTAINAPDRRFGGLGGAGGGGGGATRSVDDVVAALESLEKKLDGLDLDVTLEIDGKEIARATRKADRRYQGSTVVTK